MRSIISTDKEFYIISRSVDNASKCRVISSSEDYFSVIVPENVKFEENESVELFAMTKYGYLYFETFIQNADGNILNLLFPLTHKFLQRRVYTRIYSETEIKLCSAGQLIKADIIDISAGGLKVITQNPLQLKSSYEVEFEIDKKQINCEFEPIRAEAVENGFISSGRFKNISNSDRIALVQYCFRIQAENVNK